MPYELEWEPTGVALRFSGVVSDEDLLAASNEVSSDPRFLTLHFKIVDLATIERFAVSTATVRSVAVTDRALAKKNGGVRIAVVASGPLLQGMTNLYALSHESGGGSWETQIFASEQDAREWVCSPRPA